jgi:hypothetical protein
MYRKPLLLLLILLFALTGRSFAQQVETMLQKYIRGEGGQVMLSNGVILDVAKRKKAEFLKAIGY